MQAVKSLGLMVGAGVLVGGGGMLAMSYLARQALAPTEASAGAPAAPRVVAEPDEVEFTPPPAPEQMPDGMPSGPVMTPDALQTAPPPSGPRPDGSVDADGTPGFVPTQPQGTLPASMGERTMPAPSMPAPAPVAQLSGAAVGPAQLDPKGTDPVPSR